MEGTEPLLKAEGTLFAMESLLEPSMAGKRVRVTVETNPLPSTALPETEALQQLYSALVSLGLEKEEAVAVWTEGPDLFFRVMNKWAALGVVKRRGLEK